MPTLELTRLRARVPAARVLAQAGLVSTDLVTLTAPDRTSATAASSPPTGDAPLRFMDDAADGGEYQNGVIGSNSGGLSCVVGPDGSVIEHGRPHWANWSSKR